MLFGIEFLKRFGVGGELLYPIFNSFYVAVVVEKSA